jgi:cullin 3
VEGGHKMMMEHLSHHIRDVAMQLIQAHENALLAASTTTGATGSSSGGSGKKEGEEKVQKETFVEPMLELKEKFNRILKEACQSDPTFQRTQNQAFEAALNSNRHSPEFLSLYIDEKLKRGLRGVSEDQAEAVIERAVELFRLISEKDVFERYYKQHLARRLLLGKSVSDYAERQVIASLKRECGYQFTSRLEGMFQDMRTSHDTMEAFERQLNGKAAPMELAVQVLTTGFWPVQQTPQCILPPLVSSACLQFQDFYLARHSGRRLTWQTSMGSADVRAHLAPGGSVILNVSTYQMVVLLLFNDAERLSLEAVQQASNIEDKELRRHLLSLLRFKVRPV